MTEDVRGQRRRRICGLETEYAVFYEPDDPSDTSAPAFPLIESILFQSILDGRKAARSLGVKGGYFLENGGLAHLEIFLDEQADCPILELCTPECTNARDLLRYQRAYDLLLSTASDKSWKRFLRLGYRGRLAFGKNNLDARGTGYGCHENFLVEQELTGANIALLALAAPILLALYLPWITLIISVFTLFLFALGGYLAILLLFRIARSLNQEFAHRTAKHLKQLVQHFPPRFSAFSRRAFVVLTTACLYPGVTAYTFVLRGTAHRRLIRNLTPFFVTRQIISGSGRLNPATGQFELSQRARLTSSLSKIILFGRRKTVFDLKGFLYDPFALFRSMNRFTTCMGDSNLSDHPNLVKIGGALLLIDMVESGADFSDLELRSPLTAFKETSVGGPWKNVRLRDGRELPAIHLQQEYLRRARSFFSDADDATREILDDWEDLLQRIAERPNTLATRLDWAAKKLLLDRAILARTNWKDFSLWSRVFHELDRAGVDLETTLSDAVRRLPFIARRRTAAILASHGFPLEDAEAMYSLYYQCRAIDLRFHEISCRAGFQRELESEGMLERLTDDHGVRQALVEPPGDTRARRRGYYIKLNASLSRKAIQAGWDRVILVHSSKSISLANPFEHELPSD